MPTSACLLSTSAHPESPARYHFLAHDPESPHGRQSWWQPIPLRRIAFSSTLFICFALLSAVVLSHYLEDKYGSVLVAKNGNGLSYGQIFLFKYLPTILIVLFGMWISVIDLDAKRLEPFYKSSQNVLHTHSPLACSYDTACFLPVLFRSLRRGDLIVFGSSTLLVLTNMLIPAVQNSMLLSRYQDLRSDVEVSQAADLVDPTSQTMRMSHNFLSTAYSVCWLGQDNPAFTTRDSSFAPFTHSLSADDLVDSSLIVSTKRSWAELDCWEPVSTNVITNSSKTYGGTGFTVSFDDGRGCNTSELVLVDSDVSWTYDANYEAYYFAPPSYGFANPAPSLGQACPQFPHMFLAVYRVRGLDYLNPPHFGPDGNATAMFCEPRYYSEPVAATVTTRNYSLLSYQATGPREQLSDDMFNRTDFEYLLAMGTPPPTAANTRVDSFEGNAVIQTTRLKNASVSAPTAYSRDNMIGYLLGTSQLSSDQYLNYDTLKTGYTQAYQLLFALAMSGNYDTQPEATQKAVLENVREVVALVPRFAVATEVLLFLVILVCVYLLLVAPARTLRLKRNPDSLAEMMLLARDSTVRRAFTALNDSTDEELHESLKDEPFELQVDRNGLPFLGTPSKHLPVPVKAYTNHETAAIPIGSYPFELSWFVAGMTMTTIILSTVTFIILAERSYHMNGLKLPSGMEVVNQALLNLLPTLFATLLGAYLSLLCRTASFLKPLEVLSKGNAAASNTLSASYNSLPPPLVFVKALRNGHWLLVALSITVLLSNVLTVSLAGLFVRKAVISNTSVTMHSTYRPFVLTYRSNDDVTPSTNEDSIYPLVANASGVTQLPTWTSYKYGYVPVTVNPANGDIPSMPMYQYESLGYGAELECVDLLAQSANMTSALQFRNQGTQFSLASNFTSPGGQTCQCSLNYDDSLVGSTGRIGDGFGTIGGAAPQTLSSFEIVQSYYSGASRQQGNITYQLENQCDFCNQLIVYGWVRGLLMPTQSETFNLTPNGTFEYNATIIGCTPRMKTQRALISISQDGHILATRQLGQPNYDITSSVNLTATYNTSINTVSSTSSFANRTWHTDTLSRDYPNYLYKKLNGTNLLDASQPPPSFETARTIVSDTFARIFAMQLFIDRRNLQAILPSPNNLNINRAADSSPDSRSPDSDAIAGIASFPTQRVFISLPMLIISVTILAFDLVVLAIFRLTLSPPFLPRMPFTIASQIAFFADSRVIDDVVDAGGDPKKLDERGYRYAFGRYIGKSGALCVGIEREGYVSKPGHDGGVKRRRGGRGDGSSEQRSQQGWEDVFNGKKRTNQAGKDEDVQNGVEFDALSSGNSRQSPSSAVRSVV